MKMEYWIMNTDHNLWKIIQNGKNKKSLGRDSKGGIIILPPVSFEEHAKPDNDDVNIKFLRALPPFWSQVALTLKTRGGLKYLSFDDLYNKLRSLEINVKGGSSYGSRSTVVAPTHSAFIGAASTNTKMVYSDQPSYSSSISYTPVPTGSIMEDVLHSFVTKNKPTQQLAYEDFEQAGMKINFNNKDSVRFNRRKARCYNFLQLGHFARECNVKKVDEKARYSAFKISEVKTEEPKAMMAGFESDFAVFAGNAAGGVNPVAAEFSMMGISPKANIEKQEWEVKFVESLASDKSSASETYDFASCVSSPKTNDSFSTVDVKILPKSIPAASRNRSAAIHADRSIPATSKNRSASIYAGRSIPAASRNRPASIHAGRHILAGRSNKPAPFPTGRNVPTGWTNHAARPFFRPTNLYFDNVYWPGIYNHMSMNEGRCGSVVKSSAGCSWRNNRPNMQWGSRNNGGSHQSTWFRT
nr:hypothetical protein [Tanacetum cinerariifolium]